MKSSYITETHNEIEKNYYYNIKNKEKKKIFLAVNVSVFQPFRSFIVIIINSNYMDSQFSDIRKEYKKGKLTRNTISENPFEQFARWLNDALHCGENEPTAMIVATVSPDGNNPRFCKGSCQDDRTDRTTSRQLGRFCRHPHPLRILAGTGKQAARPFRIYSPRRKVRFRPIVSKLRKMGDKPPCTLNRTVKVLYPMNKA